jgi:hypothetical protein
MDWRELLYPELRDFPNNEREPALRRARDYEFDWLEQGGILAGVVVATLIVGKLDLYAAVGDRLLSTIVAFVIAIPLLGVTAGIFMARRTRRGLRDQREKLRSSGKL